MVEDNEMTKEDSLFDKGIVLGAFGKVWHGTLEPVSGGKEAATDSFFRLQFDQKPQIFSVSFNAFSRFNEEDSKIVSRAVKHHFSDQFGYTPVFPGSYSSLPVLVYSCSSEDLRTRGDFQNGTFFSGIFKSESYSALPETLSKIDSSTALSFHPFLVGLPLTYKQADLHRRVFSPAIPVTPSTPNRAEIFEELVKVVSVKEASEVLTLQNIILRNREKRLF